MYSRSGHAIEIRNISKSYRVPKSAPGLWGAGQRETFWALKDVSLQIRPGELVGILGRNGAGKSTLLKILTRITPPSSGEIDLYGRVGSLLEVGTGFHPELTGRENIFLNGAILGMRRREIAAEFDAIVAFSGVEKFLETPVKRYSSGMYTRLAFAVAAHLRSEILLVDEVLAVGDVEFQRMCFRKIRGVAQSGRTVVFVSHHLESISALCQRAVFLDRGQVLFDGPVSEAVEAYLASFRRDSGTAQSLSRFGSGEVRVSAAVPQKAFFSPAEPKRFRVELTRFAPSGAPVYVSAHLVAATGAVIAQCDTRLLGQWFEVEDREVFELEVRHPWLRAGCYGVDLYVCGPGILDRCLQACSFEVTPDLPYPQAAVADAVDKAAVLAQFHLRKRALSEDAEFSNEV
jgi:lipopolysaccharide transport system ATP-binding protein